MATTDPRQTAMEAAAPEILYLDGRFLALKDARISVMDRGFLFGDGVYEVIPVYAGRPFRLADHLARLDRSLASIRMENPLDHDAWRQVCERLGRGHETADASLYLQVTRGSGAVRDHAAVEGLAPTVLAMLKPLSLPSPEKLALGFSAITLEDIRWHRCDIKSINLLPNVLARQQARSEGADEAILLRDGEVTEGAASNVFIVVDGLLITPPCSSLMLEGITRAVVLEVATAAGLPWAEAAIDAAGLMSADEIWLTSSMREVAPVTRLNGAPVGTGIPGALWHRIHALFNASKSGPPPS